MSWSPPTTMEPRDVAAHDALIAAYRAVIADLRSRWELAESDAQIEAVRWRTHIAAGDAEALLLQLRSPTRREARAAERGEAA